MRCHGGGGQDVGAYLLYAYCLNTTHVRPERIGHHHRAIGLLVGLKDGDHGAGQRQARLAPQLAFSV